MRDRCRRTSLSAAAAAATVLLVCGLARAHKLNIYAWVEGGVIRGEAYMSGGGRPSNVEVVVTGPGGARLGKTRTDDAGKFQFTPSLRCDHTFTVDSGDGHRAEFTVKAGELPSGLPAPSGSAKPATTPATARADAAAPPPSTPTTRPVDANTVQQLADALSGVVARAVRREFALEEDQAQLRDVVAGVGFIFGLAGLFMMWKSRRRPAAKPPER